MTRRLITVEVDGTIFAVRGWKAHGLALGAGLRPTYSGIRGAWVADTKRLPELLAYLQHRNIPAEIEDVTPRVAPATGGTDFPPAPCDAPADLQLELFDGGR